MKFSRVYTVVGKDPFECIEWKTFDAVITGGGGKEVFRQDGVEAPASWSQLAVNVVASKYFRGKLNTSEREYSVKQLIGRVVDTICDWAGTDGYFGSSFDESFDFDSYVIFKNELKYLLVNQYAAFNSPVWFNVGVEDAPQCSACFINSVEDNLGSILDLAKTEGMLFKYGSGSGVNLSNIRGSKEGLNGGGIASGPVSFMKGLDAFAGVIKSGGKTRRAAKMVILDVDHPDIMEFINCKLHEEKKAHALIDAGYDGAIDGPAYGSVFFQNSNNSVRVTDAFMRAVDSRHPWLTLGRVDSAVVEKLHAVDVWRSMAQAAWECGDPGVQFHTTINKWHTCKTSGDIKASNPCSEYMFLNDTACNLASLNIMKFMIPSETGLVLDIDGFRHAVDVVFTAMEIIVGNASYPTPKIAENSHRFRPLGLGYCNLGAALMAQGMAYDSEAGRTWAAGVTSLMSGEAYLQSARLAKKMGPFDGYAENAESMLSVIELHRDAAEELRLEDEHLTGGLWDTQDVWNDAYGLGFKYGFRNSQATVIAPTGTIGFMMDADTTGIEPAIALVATKKLVGGGVLKVAHTGVSAALKSLGYTEKEREFIVKSIEVNGFLSTTSGIKDEHLSVFDCALGERSISPMGHVKMMAAVQPFISGAISKTVNMPSSSTVEDIQNIYMESWKLGLKAVAVYRDGCKRSQPMNVSKTEKKFELTSEVKQKMLDNVPTFPPKNTQSKEQRRRLPDERLAYTHKFSIAGHEGYATVGMYDDGTPGELFVRMSKEGSTVSGLMDAFATAISIALQHGVPLDTLVEKFSHTRYEPSGFTGNKKIPMAKSITDYVFRWLDLKFRTDIERQEVSAEATANAVEKSPKPRESLKNSSLNQSDAPACATCGDITVRNGSCYKCQTCGSTTGCS